MAHVCTPLDSFSNYRDGRSPLSYEEQQALLTKSCTVYIGNLSFYTTEEQIYALFSMTGNIKRIIMGLDRNTKTPCGFCFVEYYSHADALASLRYLSGTKLDERIIRADLDPGFADGRQYGRGKTGGQVRDEHRLEFDAGRGGWGHVIARQKAIEEAEERRRMEQDKLYQDDHDVTGKRELPTGETIEEDEERYARNRDED